MYPINYGNFLTSDEYKVCKFLYYRPLFSAVANGFLLFSFVGVILSGAAYGLETMQVPVESYNVQLFDMYSKLNNQILGAVDVMAKARPENVNVCYIIKEFIDNKPSEIVFTNINISPSKYVVKGYGDSIERINKYAKGLSFGETKMVNLGDTKRKADQVDWIIEVTNKEKKK